MRPVSRLSLVSLTVSVAALLHAGGGVAAGEASTLWVKTNGSDSSLFCTLAEPCRTINHAMSVAQPGDTIQVGVGTFAENNGVYVAKNLTIRGATWLGTKVTLGWYLEPCTPTFRVWENTQVNLVGLTISGGIGGDGCTAGILNEGVVNLTGVRISNNLGHGVTNTGGASLKMTNAAIESNKGTGLRNFDSSALLLDTRITGNANGVFNQGALIVSRGLIAGNSGWGLLQSPPPTTRAVFINVTISGNGGGVQEYGGQVGFRHVTIAANTGASAEGSHATGFWNICCHAVLQNSIIAENSGRQCEGVEVAYSFISDGSCGWPAPAGFSLKLAPLALRPGGDTAEKIFHIGATKVHALLPGSSAIDAAADEYCTDIIFGDWLTDQLGTQRPVDGDGDGVAHCDMGAYEYQPPSGDGTKG